MERTPAQHTDPVDVPRVLEHTGDPRPVAAALLELRPDYGTAAALADRLAALTRTQGLRVFGVHVGDAAEAVAAVTVRQVESLSQGRFLYVDDLSTRAAARGRGYAGLLMDRVDDLALELGIPGMVQLDSGVGPHRADAHAFYHRRGMWIAGFHFMRRTG